MSLRRDWIADLASGLPDLNAVSLGGGIPYSYREPDWHPDLTPLGRTPEKPECLVKPPAPNPAATPLGARD